MQIILVSRHLKAARTITIMPRHLAIAGCAFITLVIATAAGLSSLSARSGAFGIGKGILAQEQETHRTQQHVNNNLQLMATRLGELQAQLLHLDTLGERLSALAGIKREAPPERRPQGGQGGAFVPAPPGAEELQREIDRLSRQVDLRTDELAVLESRFLEKRVRERLVPTTLPVRKPISVRRSAIAAIRFSASGRCTRESTSMPNQVRRLSRLLTAWCLPRPIRTISGT